MPAVRRNVYTGRYRAGTAESRRRVQASLDGWRLMSPREDAPRIDVGAKPKRERGFKLAPPSDGGEAPVLAAVSRLLHHHPRIAIALRVNSGAVYDQRGVPIWHHKLLRGRGVMVDIIGTLTDGRPLAIECKRPTWRGVSRGVSDLACREQEQERFIEHVRALGGVAGFVRSVDEACELLMEGALASVLERMPVEALAIAGEADG